jgi:hypothetical protein
VDDDDHTVALWGEIVIVVWQRVMRGEALRALGVSMATLALDSKAGSLGRFVVVEKAAARPSADAREELVRMARQYPVAFTAYVFEGDGFDAAAVRGIVTDVRLQSRASSPVQVHPSTPEAARWVAANAPTYASAPALEAAVRAVRRSAPAW